MAKTMPPDMSNVLADDKKQQVLALGRLGWSLRRIEDATGVRRETASTYLKAAAIPVRRPRGRPSAWPPKPASPGEVSTDPGHPPEAVQSAGTPAVSTASPPGASPPDPEHAPTASACEPYRKTIVGALALGRNARAIWQDLVDDHQVPFAYASVKRFVLTLRGSPSPEARAVITTAPGEDYGESRVMLSSRGNRHRWAGSHRLDAQRHA
jgi:hypothetical protein